MEKNKKGLINKIVDKICDSENYYVTFCKKYDPKDCRKKRCNYAIEMKGKKRKINYVR